MWRHWKRSLNNRSKPSPSPQTSGIEWYIFLERGIFDCRCQHPLRPSTWLCWFTTVPIPSSESFACTRSLGKFTMLLLGRNSLGRVGWGLSLALTGNGEEIRIATCSNHSKAGNVNFKLPFESSFSTFSCNEAHLKISVKLEFEKFVIIWWQGAQGTNGT